MKTIHNILITGLLFLLVASCNKKGASEEQTEATAEKANEENIAPEFEGEADLIVESYSFSMMLQDYGEIAQEKELPERVVTFAQSSERYHENLNIQLSKMTEGSEINLPLEVGKDVEDFKEHLRQLDGDEFVKEYLKTVDEIQDNMISSYQAKMGQLESVELNDFIEVALPALKEQQLHTETLREEISEDNG